MLRQLPEVFLVIDPLQRLAFLLESTPKIEPPPPTTPAEPGGGFCRARTEKLGLRPQVFKGRVEFSAVQFAYPTEKQKQVLNGLSFTVEPGQKVVRRPLRPFWRPF